MQREASIEAEEWSVSMHAQSMTRAEENGQHTSTGVVTRGVLLVGRAKLDCLEGGTHEETLRP